MESDNWWKGAIIYQVYPRSFKDSNGDGIGDLQGIISKLSYIQSLGVDAIWISPFFKSPMKDFGYDISDYRAIDDIFGTLDDFDSLVEKAHDLNIKVIIDQVPSHTSDQHLWFKESRTDATNPKADWYVWADAKADGSPPNNWLSIFGGSAWQWDEGRQQYFLHNFLSNQPDLNYHNSDVQKQIIQEMAFWLKRGVDGLRLDAINFCVHDKLLRDNPTKPMCERKARGFSEDNPYASQYHVYDNTQEDNVVFLEAVRDLLNQFPGTVALGEINSDNSLKTLAEYTSSNKRLHMGYSFELLSEESSTSYIRKTVETLEANIESGWPCWAVSNHDVARVVSRWGSGHAKNSASFAKIISMLVCSLRGTVCTYQGEELGLTEAEVSYEHLQDPFGIQFWPEFKGRDGCRTPMPWESQGKHLGFSHAQPWLPIAKDHIPLSVDLQERDADSTLNNYREFIRWRKTQDVMRLGNISFFDTPENTLGLLRKYENECIIAYFNLSEDTVLIDTVRELNIKPIEDEAFSTGVYKEGELRLPSYSAFFAEVL